ncbi:MAG TPA: WGR domain-containing protein [Anaerolineales bacterium]|nr:WGR domain-containing protein [Anaerolineales bacterium]
MIVLNRIDPEENMNRWYAVAVQATLFDPYAVVVAWGRRDSPYQQWRAIPVETPEQANRLASRIIGSKLKRGYRPQSAELQG